MGTTEIESKKTVDFSAEFNSVIEFLDKENDMSNNGFLTDEQILVKITNDNQNGDEEDFEAINLY